MGVTVKDIAIGLIDIMNNISSVLLLFKALQCPLCAATAADQSTKLKKKMVVSDDQFNCGNFSSTEEVSSFRFADLYLRFLFKMRKKKKRF